MARSKKISSSQMFPAQPLATSGPITMECRILDGDRVIGVAVVELEASFKSRAKSFTVTVCRGG